MRFQGTEKKSLFFNDPDFRFNHQLKPTLALNFQCELVTDHSQLEAIIASEANGNRSEEPQVDDNNTSLFKNAMRRGPAFFDLFYDRVTQKSRTPSLDELKGEQLDGLKLPNTHYPYREKDSKIYLTREILWFLLVDMASSLLISYDESSGIVQKQLKFNILISLRHKVSISPTNLHVVSILFNSWTCFSISQTTWAHLTGFLRQFLNSVGLTQDKMLVNCKAVVSKVNMLVRYTRNDRFVLHLNMEEEKFNNEYKAIWLAYNSPIYQKSSPAVRLLGTCYAQVYHSLHTAERKRVKNRDGLPYKLTPVDMIEAGLIEGTWQFDVATWWNRFLAEPHTHKKRQLYLWGAPNVGKTHFVEHVLLSKNFNKFPATQLNQIFMYCIASLRTA